MNALWVASAADGTSTAQVPAELRPSLQSQAALEALFRSLLVRAAELREGLRQWGFAQSTTERTKDLSNSLARSVGDNASEAATLQAEHSRLTAELKSDRDSHATLKLKTDELQQRHNSLQSELRSTTSCVREMEGQRQRDQNRLDEVV